MSETETTEEMETTVVDSAALTVFLDKLVPPEKLEVEDIDGNIYKLRTSISARNQIKVIRRFEEMMKNVDREKLTISQPITVTSILNAFITVSSDEVVMTAMEDCFSLAHPAALKEAISSCGNKKSKAADVFPIEELLSGVLPLFIRLLKRGTMVMSQMA